MQHRTFAFDTHPFEGALTEALVECGELAPQLLAQRQELVPRFTDYYSRLCRLPRRARRALQRQWKRSLSAIALLLALGQAPALAATIPVTPGTPPAINPDGRCSLIEAMENANGGAIHADCVAGSPGADIVTLPAASTQLLTQPHNGFNGLPMVASEITIEGKGSTIKRAFSATDEFRILAVNPLGKLTLKSCTVTGGGYFIGYGGGVYNQGTLTLTDSAVFGNSAFRGGGVFNSGTLTLNRTLVSGNGIGVMTASGGGIENSGTATLINSTVSGNVSGPSAGTGAGLFNSGGTLTLTHSTVSGNDGGDYYGTGGVDSGGTLILNRTLISGNTGGEISAFGTVTANNFNLFGHDGDPGVTGFIPGAKDIVPGEALGAILSPLANNGGPTPTHALPSGSPALDAVDAGCPPPAKDQRGEARPRDGDGDGTALCDTGAFERTVAAPGCGGGPTSGCTVNGRPNRLCLGTQSNDVIIGSSANNVILGLGGDDTIRAGTGDDVLCGELGRDSLFGEKGKDNIFGGSENDTLRGGDNDDRIFGGAGNDTLFGENGNDALNGGTGPDTCDGGAGSGDSAVSCNTVRGVP